MFYSFLSTDRPRIMPQDEEMIAYEERRRKLLDNIASSVGAQRDRLNINLWHELPHRFPEEHGCRIVAMINDFRYQLIDACPLAKETTIKRSFLGLESTLVTDASHILYASRQSEQFAMTSLLNGSLAHPENAPQEARTRNITDEYITLNDREYITEEDILKAHSLVSVATGIASALTNMLITAASMNEKATTPESDDAIEKTFTALLIRTETAIRSILTSV